MKRAIILCGSASFVMAFIGGILAFSLVVPPLVAAQSSPLQEVRASAFTLVGDDGTVLAELGRAGTGGRLLLRDAAGTQRVTLVGTGILNVWDQDGTSVVFRAGRSYPGAGGGASGLGQINGVELDPGGTISTIPPLP